MKYVAPAFPALNFIIPRDLEERNVRRLGETQGMTLRDYFAAAALHGIVASKYADAGWTNQEFAISAYVIADAMLDERDKP